MNAGTSATVDELAAESLSLQFELPQPPDKVWRALTEPELVARWILPETDGGTTVFEYRRIDSEPGRRVSYTWRDGKTPESIVTFSIAAGASGGTRLTVVHSVPASVTPSMRGAVACRMSFAACPRLSAAANRNFAAARAA